MISFRPTADENYLSRSRLLEELPDRPGFVVWLEAPYGYGKSVLASQWADHLHQHGWRVVWLSAAERDPRGLLAAHAGLPADSSWSLTLDTLWQERTLLVLEDLEALAEPETLTPLLRDVRGLVLLASRNPLAISELPRLVTRGRLVHMTSRDLGFTREEAVAFFRDEVTAEAMWTRTHGWPLPLHFASLAGDLPAGGALLGGMRASLSDEEWEEALLLATLSYLPPEAATPSTQRLARSGFVQLGEAGYRLHALVAEAIVEAHHDAARSVLRREAARLPPLVRGEAFERSDDQQGLLTLLEDPRPQTYRQAPESFVRWDALVQEPASARRHLTVGGAHKALGNHDAAIRRLEAALAAGTLETDDELMALKDLAWSSALSDPERAPAVVRRGEALLDAADAELAGRFLSDVSFVAMMAGDFPSAIAQLERSIEYLPQGSRYRTGSRINLALNRWELHGDYDHRLATQTDTLDDVWELYPSDAPGQCRDLAMMHLWAGDEQEARAYLRRAVEGERSNPLVGLEARAALARLDGEPERFARLLSKAEDWGSDYTLDAVALHALSALPAGTPSAAAEAIYRKVPRPALAATVYARFLAEAGRQDEALALLDATADGYGDRDYQLYVNATRYRLTREEHHLDAFLATTTAGARLLPGLVPLAELPRERPELSLAYPLRSVMDSGWKEASGLRMQEVPELELDVLGVFELRSFGEPVSLTDRQKQVVLLSAAGFDREQIGEALWPETPASKQRNNLGVQFHGLRKLLEPWGHSIFIVEDGVRRVRTDLAALRAALAASDAARVLELYEEPLGPGITLDALAELRIELRTEVVELLCEAAERAEPAQATRYLLRVLELDPLNEPALQSLMTRLLSRGRGTEAQRHYAAFERRLRDELGMEPLDATRAVLEAG